MKNLSCAFLLSLALLRSSSVHAEPFKGGRDIAMFSIGTLNVSLLVMMIWKSVRKKPEKPAEPAPVENVPLQSEREPALESPSPQ